LARLQLFSNFHSRKKRGRIGKFHSWRRLKPTDAARSRVICPGGVEFENRSASGGWGAVLVANSTRAGLRGLVQNLLV
jgi:hypothetical protein